MKVLMVVHQLQAGGAEVLAWDLAAGLVEDGLQCHLAALYPSDGDGLFSTMPTTILSPVIGRRNLPSIALRLLHLCRFERPDVVHSHGEIPDLLCRFVCRWLGLPLVVTTHTERPWHWRPRLGRWLERRGVPATRMYVAVSHVVAGMLAKQLGVPDQAIRVIPNWVCSTRRSSGAAGVSPELGSPTLIHVARLHIQKGQDLLLAAFSQLRRTWPEAVLWMVGTGPAEDRLRQLAGPGVVFLGHRMDVQNLLGLADLFVLSSHWEGQPLSLLEAMDQGLPVVATRVGGIPELVESGVHGILVDAGNAVALEQAMDQCLADPEKARAMGQRGMVECADLRRKAIVSYRQLYVQVLSA